MLLTGIDTGSDNELHWSVDLQCGGSGMKGEGIIDDRVFVVKSHFPWIMTKTIKANKILVIVRNPLDAIVSWLNYVSTMCHSAKVEFCFDKEYPKWWDD